MRPFADQVAAALSPGEAADLISTFSYAAAYARARRGDVAAYRTELATAFRNAGERIAFVAPLIGAIALKTR